MNFQSTGLLTPCNSVLLGINVYGYGYIYCLTAVRFLLLLTDKRLPSFLGIALFYPFLELLGYEFLQNTLAVNPWGIWLFLLLFQSMIYSCHWFCLSIHMYLYWSLLWSCPHLHVYFCLHIQLVNSLVPI